MKKIMSSIFLIACIHSLHAQLPDDSPKAREAAIERLRTAAPYTVCDEEIRAAKTYGTPCNSREFQGKPILTAPKMQWEVNPGWWGVWQPFIMGDYFLTGSCNNDGNEGLSAFDKNTGKVVWRISSICWEGNRRGTAGNPAFHQLSDTEVLLIYGRDDGGPTDHYVIDIKSGKIVRQLKPVKNGPTRSSGGVFTILTQSTKDNESYITALSQDLSSVLWQNSDFMLAMKDKLDRHYTPTFSAPAAYQGILYQTARSKQQPGIPTRQLHAIDLKSGKTIWRHTAQPIVEVDHDKSYRSDDGVPMVADGKVIIRLKGLSGPAEYGMRPFGEGLRAFDRLSGKILWTTKAHPKQEFGNRVAVGKIIITEVKTQNERELWAYHLSDGSLAWRRPIGKHASLLCSSGGAFYVGETIYDADFKVKENKLYGMDGETGTLLWEGTYRENLINLSSGDRWDIESIQGHRPTWTIDRDGAIYGVTVRGAFKMK